MKICGPKLSICCTILSVWGVVQLGLLGVFFYIKSVALADDLAITGGPFETPSDFYAAADEAYEENAYNCWIAAALYLATFFFAGWQFQVNRRLSK